MAFDTLLSRIRQAKADLINNREAELMKMALDGLALVKLRIQTRGQSADGPQFAPYVPAYANERKKAGYQIGFVDYTRTGRFWAGVKPSIENSDLTSTTIVITAGDERGENILRGAREKRGNLLKLSDEEIAFLQEANRQRVEKHLNQIVLE